jgi:hypothetical protein
MLLAWPLMALTLRGSAGSIFAGQVKLAVLVGANGGAGVTFSASLLLPHTAPHRLTREFQATRLR